ncbi:matrix metalloproteinase-21-like [Lampetra fluviatilis]
MSRRDSSLCWASLGASCLPRLLLLLLLPGLGSTPGAADNAAPGLGRDLSELRGSRAGLRPPRPPISARAAQIFLARYGWLDPVPWREGSGHAEADPATAPWDDLDFANPVPDELPVEPDSEPAHSDSVELPAWGAEAGAGPAEEASRRGERAGGRAGVAFFVGVGPAVADALRRFQAAHGLEVTGLLDPGTREAMSQPRCGVPDRQTGEAADDWDRASPAEEEEAEEAAPPPAAAFAARVVRWRLLSEGFSTRLSVVEQRAVVRLAFRMWSEVAPLVFKEDLTSPPGDVDIRLGFGTGRHLGCPRAFDGWGREVAHAWTLGDVHFDDDEDFRGLGEARGISLLKVAVHEIGHVLGLRHALLRGSVMLPEYPGGGVCELHPEDRRAVQHLYGVCKGRFDVVLDWVRRPPDDPTGPPRYNTFFLRSAWYWLYENRSQRTRYGDPRPIAAGWRGLPPGGVDAFVHAWTWSQDCAYFFRGSYYWRYDSERDQAFVRDPQGVAYPRLISEGFPGVPYPLDTAYFDRRDQNIYFFKGSGVTVFNVRLGRVSPGPPRALRSVFPALLGPGGDHPGGGLDAAYYSYAHGALFLLKGPHAWRALTDAERRAWASGGSTITMKETMKTMQETMKTMQVKVTLPPRNALLPRQATAQIWRDICDAGAAGA